MNRICDFDMMILKPILFENLYIPIIAFDPDSSAAGQRFVRRIDNLARPVDPYAMSVGV